MALRARRFAWAIFIGVVVAAIVGAADYLVVDAIAWSSAVGRYVYDLSLMSVPGALFSEILGGLVAGNLHAGAQHRLAAAVVEFLINAVFYIAITYWILGFFPTKNLGRATLG